MNPGPKSAPGTPYSGSEFVRHDTDELIRLAKEEGGLGTRKQAILKELARGEFVSDICWAHDIVI
jgi:hypothetical protein